MITDVSTLKFMGMDCIFSSINTEPFFEFFDTVSREFAMIVWIASSADIYCQSWLSSMIWFKESLNQCSFNQQF